MSDFINKTDSEWISDLSEQEQETLKAGFTDFIAGDFFFFQDTDIQSIAANQTSLTGDDGLSRQKSGYTYSQVTLAFGSFVADVGQSLQKSPVIGGMINKLFGSTI